MSGNASTRFQFRLNVFVKWLGIIIFLLLIFAPLAALIAAAAEYIPNHYSEVIKLLIPTERRIVLLANSLGLSLAVAVKQ